MAGSLAISTGFLPTAPSEHSANPSRSAAVLINRSRHQSKRTTIWTAKWSLLQVLRDQRESCSGNRIDSVLETRVRVAIAEPTAPWRQSTCQTLLHSRRQVLPDCSDRERWTLGTLHPHEPREWPEQFRGGSGHRAPAGHRPRLLRVQFENAPAIELLTFDVRDSVLLRPRTHESAVTASNAHEMTTTHT